MASKWQSSGHVLLPSGQALHMLSVHVALGFISRTKMPKQTNKTHCEPRYLRTLYNFLKLFCKPELKVSQIPETSASCKANSDSLCPFLDSHPPVLTEVTSSFMVTSFPLAMTSSVGWHWGKNPGPTATRRGLLPLLILPDLL